MRAFCAKVSGRFVALFSRDEGSIGGCAGLAARLDRAPGAEENGLVKLAENGFRDCRDAETGLSLAVKLEFPPNNAAPRSCCASPCCCSGIGSVTAFSFCALPCFGSPAPSLVTLTPLTARMLPSFRLQGFLLQAHMYSRRS